jgi:hypothetical protein
MIKRVPPGTYTGRLRIRNAGHCNCSPRPQTKSSFAYNGMCQTRDHVQALLRPHASQRTRRRTLAATMLGIAHGLVQHPPAIATMELWLWLWFRAHGMPRVNHGVVLVLGTRSVRGCCDRGGAMSGPLNGSDDLWGVCENICMRGAWNCVCIRVRWGTRE